MDDAELEQLTRLVASDDPADVDRAHDRALVAMGRDARVRILAAMAYDRIRALAGKPQKFGTQAVLVAGRRVLWPVDAGTTDSERHKWGIESLERLRACAVNAPLIGKAPLRRLLRDRRSAVTAAEHDVAGDALAGFADRLPGDRIGAVVAAYWPLPGEADPRPLARRLAALGRATLALPVVDGDELTFRAWRGDEDLEDAGFRTLGPARGAPVVVPSTVLVPLVGFDRGGARLGQGKGYYDRWLERHAGPAAPLSVGVAFACQELPVVPTEAHDRHLDAIVTERTFVAVDQGL